MAGVKGSIRTHLRAAGRHRRSPPQRHSHGPVLLRGDLRSAGEVYGGPGVHRSGCGVWAECAGTYFRDEPDLYINMYI